MMVMIIMTVAMVRLITAMNLIGGDDDGNCNEYD